MQFQKKYFEKLDKSEIKQELLKKNVGLEQLVKNDGVFEIIFISDERDHDYSYAVIKVDKQIKNFISSQGMRVYIGLSSCKVSERFHLLQCYACQKFGHRIGSQDCDFSTTNQVICLYCAEKHSSKNCPNKRNTNLFKCSNCATSDEKNIVDSSKGHTTTSVTCPILQQQLKSLMNRTVGTTYKTNISKNVIST